MFVISKTAKPASVSVDAQYKDFAPGTATTLDPNTEQARQIRRALVDDKSLSTASQNVTIELKDGIAHLKGTVPNEAEKNAVESKAASVDGKDKVVNNLEVTTK